MKKRLEILITGRVQGVLFRARTQDTAKSLNFVGYVKNEPDGSVKIIAEGEEENLKELANWCKNGVESAQVERVQVDFLDATGEYSDFTIQY